MGRWVVRGAAFLLLLAFDGLLAGAGDGAARAAGISSPKAAVGAVLGGSPGGGRLTLGSGGLWEAVGEAVNVAVEAQVGAYVAGLDLGPEGLAAAWATSRLAAGSDALGFVTFPSEAGRNACRFTYGTTFDGILFDYALPRGTQASSYTLFLRGGGLGVALQDQNLSNPRSGRNLSADLHAQLGGNAVAAGLAVGGTRGAVPAGVEPVEAGRVALQVEAHF